MGYENFSIFRPQEFFEGKRKKVLALAGLAWLGLAGFWLALSCGGRNFGGPCHQTLYSDFRIF